MNRNERTPRTLADCQWQTGYPTMQRGYSRWNLLDFLTAVAIGAALALVVAYHI